MAFFHDIPRLPEDENQDKDVEDNKYKQNKAINAIGHNMKEIITLVSSHDEIVQNLRAIRKGASTVFGFIKFFLTIGGLTGFVAAIKWIITLHH